MDKAAEVAGGYVEKKENVVNLLKQQEGVASNQIMLKVRFAEVSRNALQELGVSFFADNKNSRWFGRTTTQQFAAPYFDKNQPSAALDDTMVFSDYLNLFLFDAKNSIGAAVRALQSKGVFQSLAEPNLIASNGKEASFLAGGEFPYPVPQGNFGSFTIHFKEYGVRLTFTPTVVGGDLIHLKLKPEVSSLDFNNAIVIEGFRIPALTSRRTETEVELRDGQTFAIAGLMNNSVLQSMRKVPGLGDIPILGYLFQSKAYQKEQTELVVMVTPHDRAPQFDRRLGRPAWAGRAVSRTELEAAAQPGALQRFALHRRAEGSGWRRPRAGRTSARALRWRTFPEPSACRIRFRRRRSRGRRTFRRGPRARTQRPRPPRWRPSRRR